MKINCNFFHQKKFYFLCRIYWLEDEERCNVSECQLKDFASHNIINQEDWNENLNEEQKKNIKKFQIKKKILEKILINW